MEEYTRVNTIPYAPKARKQFKFQILKCKDQTADSSQQTADVYSLRNERCVIARTDDYTEDTLSGCLKNTVSHSIGLTCLIKVRYSPLTG